LLWGTILGITSSYLDTYLPVDWSLMNYPLRSKPFAFTFGALLHPWLVLMSALVTYNFTFYIGYFFIHPTPHEGIIGNLVIENSYMSSKIISFFSLFGIMRSPPMTWNPFLCSCFLGLLRLLLRLSGWLLSLPPITPPFTVVFYTLLSIPI